MVAVLKFLSISTVSFSPFHCNHKLICHGQVAGLALAYGLHLFHGNRNYVASYSCDRSPKLDNPHGDHDADLKVDLRTILKTIFRAILSTVWKTF